MSDEGATMNEAIPAPCGWCGNIVRWSVPNEREKHSWGRCVGNEVDVDLWASEGRLTVIQIRWEDDVTGEDIRRLSRAWSLKISEKPVVVSTHVNTYGTAKT